MDPVTEHHETSPIEEALPQTQSWLDIPLRVRPDLKYDVRTQGDREVYVIEDPVRAKFYQVGKAEFELINCLDGKLPVRQSLQDLNAERAADDLLEETSANSIAAWLVQCNLAYSPSADGTQRLEQQAKSLKNQKLMSLINPISIKFKLFNPTRLLDATAAYSGWLFTKTFFVLWFLLACVGLYSVSANWSEISSSSVGILSNGRWIWMLLVWIVLKAIHEWAHGIACRRFGGNVPEAGMLLLLFTPMPYVNVTSSWRFRNRWHRFFVAGAGMYVELFISFIAMIVWANTNSVITKDICFNIFFLSSVTTVLFNANPLMRFDGYYMLADLLDIPNLYSKGLKWFGDRLKWLLFGTPKTPNICPPAELPYARLYGTMAFCWKILISFSLLIGASVLFYGAGVLMAMVGGVMWLAVPVYRFFKSTFAVPNPNYQIGRVALSSICLLGLVASIFTFLHSPATKSAPAIVQFENEQLIRANGDGFIQQILVKDGQRVSRGEMLAVLFNDELQTEVANLKREITETEIKVRIHNKSSELAAGQTELKNRESLLQQLEEKQQQLENLKITAPFDGFVFQRGLSNRVGEYLQQGDEVLSVAQTSSRKIVVSIDQEDLESIQSDELHAMRVALPGQSVFRAEVNSIDTRATDRPSIPAFCASFGGPLPVEPTPNAQDNRPENRYRLLAPRFEVQLMVDEKTGIQLNNGQVGRAFFATRRQSLGAFLYLETSKWFRRQIEQAMIGR
jgi:putative peptide zinc metalloprotease protein